MCGKFSRCVSVLFLLFSSQYIFAETAELPSSQISIPDLSLCPGRLETTRARVEPRAFSLEDRGNTEISADFTETTSDGSTSLDGNIIIERHLIRVTADHANYNKQDDEINFSGNVHIDTENMSLNADGGTVNINNADPEKKAQGRFENISFFIPDSKMNGTAETIHSGKTSDDRSQST